jgi:type IV secretory pathway TrbF-like protein
MTTLASERKSATARYDPAPEPKSSRQRTRQLGERAVSAFARRNDWRMAFLAALLLGAVLVDGIAGQARGTTAPSNAPHNATPTQAPAPATSDLSPTDPQIAWLLSRFITQVRSIPADSFVLSQNFLDAYHYAADKGAIALNEYARDNDPYAKMIGKARVEVAVSSVTRASDDGFRIAWIERHYTEGALSESQRWYALLTVLVTTPSDATREKANPLGIYVQAIDWSQQVDTAISDVEP